MSTSQPDAPPDASQAASAEDATRRSERKASMWAIGLTSLFAVAIIVSIPLALWLVKVAGVSSKTSPVEINLAIVLIAAAAALILIIGSLTIVFRRLKLQDRKEAMGLPSGSIRAIIALLLIVLFFISAIYLYSTVQQSEVRGPARTLTGVTAAQLAALPQDQIDGVVARTQGTITVYDVTLAGRLERNGRADDLAAQLITTVATLVVSVASFYFGANAVSSAAKIGLKAGSGGAGAGPGAGAGGGGAADGGGGAGGAAAGGPAGAAGADAAAGGAAADAGGAVPGEGEGEGPSEVALAAADSPDDAELSILESADVTEPEIEDIKASQAQPDTPRPDDPEVG